ncbi:hypothetical protein H9W90_14705 [Polaribacter pectinis]|uniref:Uncharacterized protein n=1 Tax=Polaribacter pectinis TaxID=2738844 RepID=A0A7G9L9W8_9FLAO|nr:hypothetical protein [Polaribacter pectinis]QNM85417.1 hypothetical protein H9W90_14705 [Polaribacter pectinis]
MENQPNNIPKPNPRNTISLEVAKQWAKEWRDDEASYNKYNQCRAFNIPKKDLIEVLAEGVESIRAYIGVEKIDVKGKQSIFTEKLMIVGVDKNGKDMISSSDGLTLDDGKGEIFDFSEPCPHVCDEGSPINGG